MSSLRSARAPGSLPVALPPGRTVQVRAADGTRLHTEIFGPDDGYPIVFAPRHHLRAARLVQPDRRPGRRPPGDRVRPPRSWPQRGSRPARLRPGPPGGATSNAVLDATLRTGRACRHRRAFDGRHRHRAWSDGYRDTVPHRADAVALINTTTGDLLRELRLADVPGALAATRVRIAEQVIRAIGSLKVPTGA